jgi:cobalt-zinc-cadmium efflux system protein
MENDEGMTMAQSAEHDHDGCSHGHGGMHVHGATEGPMLWVSLVVTLVFVVGEAWAGLRSHSLALLSDSGHNFSDAFALGLAAYAIWIARRPVNPAKTFGYHRVAVLTALFNASTLILIGLAIFVEAIEVFRHPRPIQSGLMMAVAGVSVVMNTVIATALARSAKNNLNVRAAFVHMTGDALSAVAVLVAGFVVHQTGWEYADPLVSVLIAAFILYSSWGIVREATDILLEGTPKGLDVAAMVEAMSGVSQVQSVHDVHVWTVSDGMNFLSCHVEVEDSRTMDDCAGVVACLNRLLHDDFGIGHATIQTERAGNCGDSARQSSPLCAGAK